MSPREKLAAALAHKTPGKVPLDFGATFATGISIVALDALISALGLPRRKLKLFDPYQMLGHVDDDVLEAVGADCRGIHNERTLFGYDNGEWKDWSFRGLDVLVAHDFNTTTDGEGNTYLYPSGDTGAQASGMIPAGGLYADAVIRQRPPDQISYDARADYAEDHVRVGEKELAHHRRMVEKIYTETDFGVVSVLTPLSLCDNAHLPAPSLAEPRGVRDIAEFLTCYITHPSYVHEKNELHVEAALASCKKYYEAVGDRVQAICVSGADYGMQSGLFISRDMFREFIMPYMKTLNDWIHANTKWKTWVHSCGGISEILGDMIGAGVDIINPVQFSARGMDLRALKREYGRDLVFWGGAADVQSTLGAGAPDEVRSQTLRNMEILAEGGGFVAAATHNIQAGTPVANMLAYFDAVREFNS